MRTPELTSTATSTLLLLGLVVEVFRMPLRQFVAREVLEPLDLRQTLYRPQHQYSTGFARGAVARAPIQPS